MDRFWSLIQNNPVGLTSFVRIVVGGAGAFGWELTAAQLAYVMSVLEAFLALITYKVVTPNAHVEEKVDAKVAYREMVRGTGSGTVEPMLPTIPVENRP